MRNDDLLRKSWLLCLLLLGVGQILPAGWWYFFKGISVGDGLFMVLSLVEILFFVKRDDLKSAIFQARFVLFAIGLIVVALAFSTIWNYTSYISFKPEYVFSIFRLVYFAVMVLMIASVVRRRLSVKLAVKFYLMGLAAALVLNLFNDFVWMIPNERCGLYIWSNPNVIGNIACIGLLYMALWLKEGARPYVGYIAMYLLLSYSALLAFSKASWIMLVLGNILLLVCTFRSSTIFLKNVRYAGIAAVVIFAATIFLQMDKVACYMNLKIASSVPSLEIRKNYAVSALSILTAKPWGIGMGRYVEVVSGAPVSDREAAQVGYSSAGNPHSTILHLMISGGYVAVFGLIFLISAVAHAFVAAAELSSSKKLNALVFVLFGAILLISASFQLQIITQNFLYLLAGVMLSAKLKESEQI